MTDTLKSDLNCVISALLEAGLGLKSTHVAAVEKAIAELDRLEAEVKKPRLPEGWTIEQRSVDLIDVYQSGDRAFTSYGGSLNYRFLSAFLTTPDEVPSTAEKPIGQDVVRGAAAACDRESGDFHKLRDRMAAEKPKPVSLVNRFKIEISHVSALTMGDPVPQLWFSWLMSRIDEEIADIRRTLDQERT